MKKPYNGVGAMWIRIALVRTLNPGYFITMNG